MNSFWTTPNTYKALYGENYRVIGSFSATHLIELGLIVLATVLLAIFYKKCDEKKKHRILLILTVLLWIDEVFKYVFTLATNQWMWNYLPLHLCSINIFTCTIYTFTKSEKARDILYTLCIPGAVLALIFSPWFAAPVWNAMHLHSYTVHAILIIYSVLAICDTYKPDLKRIPFNFALIVSIAVPMLFINKLLNTNFLYISKPSEIIITKLMADLVGQYYPILFLPLLALVWFLLYLPWFLPKKKIAN